jgi:hypothetical protein
VLSKFCSSWKLEVNTKKSKIMIFNSNGKSFLNHFKLDNEYLETNLLNTFNPFCNPSSDSDTKIIASAYIGM